MKKLLLTIPILAACLVHQARADAVVSFNEVMYHPATNESTMEWVEFRNLLAMDVDMSEWSISGAIEYTFPVGTVIRGRGYLVVAVSPATLMANSGLAGVLGPFSGRLGNNGETIRLRNNSGRVIDELSYQTEDEWPVAADGSGASLAKRDPDSASGSAANWASSEFPGGTPGVENVPDPNLPRPDTLLFDVTAQWKFDASGVDLGTAWRDSSYNDASWGSRSNLANRSIDGLYNTGVGDNKVALAAGSNDPHYILSAGAQGTVGAPALVILNHPAWLANDAVSSFISVVNPGSANIADGAYNFRTTFSLSGIIPATAQISASVAVDNRVSDILINGVSSGLTTSGFASFNAPLTATGGFVSGLNTLEFRAVNEGAGPGGFRALVSGSGLGANPTPPLAAGRSTYYFRRSFTLNGDPALTKLRINPILADGGVLYLNGVEVFRQNMPAGAVSYATAAVSDVASPSFTGLVEISAASLVAGANVLAVEIHQAAAGADEPIFGMQLISTPLPATSSAAVPLAFSEVSAATNSPFFVEIQNYGTEAIALGNYSLHHDGVVDHVYNFPASSLNPGEYLAVTAQNLGFPVVSGDKFVIVQSATGKAVDGVAVKNRSRARAPLISSPWANESSLTPGAANVVNFRSEIVINEIMHSPALLRGTNGEPHASPEEWLELYNRGSSPVDLAGWQLSGGISYLFTPGQSIPAGGYLVIADDVPYVRSLHPGIALVGDYGGRLGSSDHIVLHDPSGNVADEVRYHTGGNWPEYSGTGGSSMELRDPASDNSRAEAWAASDETAKGGWRTYSYRMTAAIPAGSGQPTQWQDFILGLQGAGECLVDDLSVIELPASAPVEIISNGDFESGLAGWRVLGTHNQSRIDTDPDNAANHVLRVVATGPQEHMHNHIERTLNAGKTISASREYEISFRARWLAGNNLLNTRLYFNRAAKTAVLPIPGPNGTPGAPNSRLVANAGPTFSSFGHKEVVPHSGEPVTVTVVAEDPQGVASCNLFWSVNSGAWANATMTHQGGGVYTGTIPGQAAGAVVQFYVRAADSLGATAMYPANGTNSGALFKVSDGLAKVALTSNVRIILTPDNINLLHGNAQGVNQTNVMSNDLIPCTVIYNEQRAYYNCGVHLRGSQRGRYSDIRTGYHIEFPPDDLFRGVHPVMLIDRSGAGDTPTERQEEVLLKHMLNRAGGLPGTYGEICHLLAPRNAFNGAAQFFPRHEDVFVESTYGGGGQQFEMELIYYPTTANTSGYKNPQPDGVIGTDMTDLGGDKELYRYNFMLKGAREEDDYSRFITLCKAWSQTGDALDVQTKALMDIDQWMRAYAFVSLGGVGDMYTFGNNHNFFTYSRPSDGKFVYFPWDMDFSFNRAATDTTAIVGDQNLGKIVKLPGNLRVFYAHALDIIDTCFNSAYMTPWINYYQSVSQGQNFAPRIAYIQTRANTFRTAINTQTGTNFTVAGTNVITATNNLVVLTGSAPAAVRTILINGVEYPVTWTSVSGWRLVVAVGEATTVLNITTLDVKGQPQTNFDRTVTVNYTGPALDPNPSIVINEIMYNPAVPDAGFVEIFNPSSTSSVNLTGWRINGIGYDFPDGTTIASRQYLVIAANIPGYYRAYGSSAIAPLGPYPGNLQNDGETLTLLKPGAEPGTEVVVDRVRYEGVPAWPTAPNGMGPSLQLIDATRDNSRVGNWSDGAGWLYTTFTGTIQGGSNPGTNFLIFLNTPGDVFIDDIVLVTGTEAGVGQNLIANGDFESPLGAAWTVQGNHADTAISTEDHHGGSASLHLVATGIGSASANIRQFIPAFASSTVCTISFWYRPTLSASNLTMRTTPGSVFAPKFTVQPVFATPGFANTAAGPLPAFSSLWLNEAQAENVSGITDNQGEHEPWIELYNAGNTSIDLTGYTLANNYTNLAQWSFPAGTSILPGEFKVVFADGQPGQTTAGEWHTGFRLAAGHGSIALGWTSGGGLQVLDYLNYTNLPPDRSYGAFPDGQPFERHEFYRVTAGATNNNVAPPIVAYVNEWMAANTGFLLNTNNGNRFDDWFELYNPGNTAANLEGYYLSDNLENKTQFRIPAGYVIPAHGYLLVWADGQANLNTNTDSALHVSFKLAQGGEALGLFASDGTVIDAADFGTETQFDNISEGRFPDGPNATYFLATPTPLAANTTWANRYPSLAIINDATLVSGETLAFTAVSGDPDLPVQTLTYSLNGSAPTGAVINATSGEFTWTPSPAQTPSVNTITVRVTDSGIPALTTARTFTVTVSAGFRVTGITRQPNGNVAFTIGATVGKTYRVEYKDDLNAAVWQPLGADQVANSATLTITDVTATNAQRFYRVRQLD